MLLLLFDSRLQSGSASPAAALARAYSLLVPAPHRQSCKAFLILVDSISSAAYFSPLACSQEDIEDEVADELIETAPGLFFRDPATNKLAVGNAREYEHMLEKVRVQAGCRGQGASKQRVAKRQHQGRGLEAEDRMQGKRGSRAVQDRGKEISVGGRFVLRHRVCGVFSQHNPG